MSAIEPRNPSDRELLQRLIRDACAASGQTPDDPIGASCVSLPDLFRTIRARGTQLEGVSATELRKFDQGQVREELFAMQDVQVLEANTPRERFQLTS